MIRVLISIIAIAFASLVVQYFLPWWSLAIVTFFIGIVASLRPLQSFITGFIGVAIVWWGYAASIDINTAGILTERIAQILFVQEPLLLILLTGTIAGTVGAFSALSGSLLNKPN